MRKLHLRHGLNVELNRKKKETAPLDALDLEADTPALSNELLRLSVSQGRINTITSLISGRMLSVLFRNQAPDKVRDAIPESADPNDLYIFRVTEPAQNGELPRQHFFARLRGSSNAPRFFVNGTH